MFPVFSRIWLINISLAVLVVFLGIMSFNVWLKADETIPEIQTGKSSEKPLPGKRIMERTMPPDSTYGIVAEKNLFSSNRSESVPVKQEPGQLKISEKMIFLYGVVITGNLKQALVSNPDPAPQAGNPPLRDKWVKVGDAMGNFSVSDIRKDRIILAEGADMHEILLYDKNKPTRQTVAAVASAAPTVVAAGTAAAAAKPAAESTISRAEAGKSAAEGEYVIINTPFGPTKRRVK
ncbi:MAG: hypothetical protein NTW71_14400 [Deltaproteobacteria bacterium]|nr:hypothetical protein [Deltaproteobacteria bacterium]